MPSLRLSQAPLLLSLALGLTLGHSRVARASDWLCEEAASVRRGTEILACGVGEGPTEDVARKKALVAAQLEFLELCGSSDDCKNHKSISSPLRTTCSTLPSGQVRCYRGLSYQITPEVQTTSIFNEATQEALMMKRLALQEELKVLSAIEAEKKEVDRLEKKIQEKDFSNPEPVKVPAQAEAPVAARPTHFSHWAFGLTKGTANPGKNKSPALHVEYQSYRRLWGILGFGYSLAGDILTSDVWMPSQVCGGTCNPVSTETVLKDYTAANLNLIFGADLNEHFRIAPVIFLSKTTVAPVRLSYTTNNTDIADYADTLGNYDFFDVGVGAQLIWKSFLGGTEGSGTSLVLDYRKISESSSHPAIMMISLSLAFGRGW